MAGLAVPMYTRHSTWVAVRGMYHVGPPEAVVRGAGGCALAPPLKLGTTPGSIQRGQAAQISVSRLRQQGQAAMYEAGLTNAVSGVCKCKAGQPTGRRPTLDRSACLARAACAGPGLLGRGRGCDRKVGGWVSGGVGATTPVRRVRQVHGQTLLLHARRHVSSSGEPGHRRRSNPALNTPRLLFPHRSVPSCCSPPARLCTAAAAAWRRRLQPWTPRRLSASSG